MPYGVPSCSRQRTLRVAGKRSLAAVVAQAWLLPNPSIPPRPASHEYFSRLACWLDFGEFSI